MIITWHGLSCFKIETNDLIIGISPFAKNEKLGIQKAPRFKAQVLLLSSLKTLILRANMKLAAVLSTAFLVWQNFQRTKINKTQSLWLSRKACGLVTSELFPAHLFLTRLWKNYKELMFYFCPLAARAFAMLRKRPAL